MTLALLAFLLNFTVGLSSLARFNVCELDSILSSRHLPELPELGLDVYDVRRTCDRNEDVPLCSKQLQWVETWMDDPAIKQELGAQPFETCNMGFNQGFASQGDGMRNSALLLTDLVNEGIRLLVYAGTAGMCPRVSNLREC